MTWRFLKIQKPLAEVGGKGRPGCAAPAKMDYISTGVFTNAKNKRHRKANAGGGGGRCGRKAFE